MKHSRTEPNSTPEELVSSSSLPLPLRNSDTDIFIDVLGITAISGYEAKVNHCIGLCKIARKDYHLLLMCSSTNIHSYTVNQKHRIMYTCLIGNIDWFRTLLSMGNTETLLSLRGKVKEIINISIHYTISGEVVYTPFTLAVNYRHINIVKELLQYLDKFDINQRIGSYQYSALYLACQNNDLPMVQLLCRIPDIDLNSSDSDGFTPLMVGTVVEYHRGETSSQSNVDIFPKRIIREQVVRELLQYPDRININQQDNDSYTALHYTVVHDNIEVLKILCSYPGIDLNIKAYNGNAILSLMYEQSFLSIDVVKEILKYQDKYKINSRNKDGNTALHIACTKTDVEIVKILCTFSNTNFSIRNKKGEIPLLSAISNISNDAFEQTLLDGDVTDSGRIETVKELLLHQDKFDINTVDNHGNTALNLAMKKHYTEIIELLSATD